MREMATALSGTTAQIVGVPTWLIIGAAVVLVSLLIATTLLTVGYSVGKSIQRRRRDSVREELRADILDRLYGPDDPGWESWVGGLSTLERSVVEALLDEYLRELRGSDIEPLFGLGDALGIPERSRRRLESGGYYERLHALTWLALLQDPPAVSELERHCSGTPRERAAAVRVLYASNHIDLASDGTRLLLGNTTSGFSVFGIDTLYRVAESNPMPVFERAASDWDAWDPALLQQVLLVTRHVNTVVGGADLSWVVDAQSSPDERTRIEATRTMGGYGWRRSLREQVRIDALTTDASPNVRTSAYRMLGEWGNEEAIETLLDAAARETDDRARVAAAEAIVPYLERYPVTLPPSLVDAWFWAAAHAAFDDIAIDISQGGREQYQ